MRRFTRKFFMFKPEHLILTSNLSKKKRKKVSLIHFSAKNQNSESRSQKGETFL